METDEKWESGERVTAKKAEARRKDERLKTAGTEVLNRRFTQINADERRERKNAKYANAGGTFNIDECPLTVVTWQNTSWVSSPTQLHPFRGSGIIIGLDLPAACSPAKVSPAAPP